MDMAELQKMMSGMGGGASAGAPPGGDDDGPGGMPPGMDMEALMAQLGGMGGGGGCSPLLAKAKEGGHPMSKERAETHVSHVSCTLLLARIHI